MPARRERPVPSPRGTAAPSHSRQPALSPRKAAVKPTTPVASPPTSPPHQRRGPRAQQVAASSSPPPSPRRPAERGSGDTKPPSAPLAAGRPNVAGASVPQRSDNQSSAVAPTATAASSIAATNVVSSQPSRIHVESTHSSQPTQLIFGGVKATGAPSRSTDIATTTATSTTASTTSTTTAPAPSLSPERPTGTSAIPPNPLSRSSPAAGHATSSSVPRPAAITAVTSPATMQAQQHVQAAPTQVNQPAHHVVAAATIAAAVTVPNSSPIVDGWALGRQQLRREAESTLRALLGPIVRFRVYRERRKAHRLANRSSTAAAANSTSHQNQNTNNSINKSQQQRRYTLGEIVDSIKGCRRTFLAAWPHEVLAELLRRAHIRFCHDGEVIVYEGEPWWCSGVIVALSGAVCIMPPASAEENRNNASGSAPAPAVGGRLVPTPAVVAADESLVGAAARHRIVAKGFVDCVLVNAAWLSEFLFGFRTRPIAVPRYLSTVDLAETLKGVGPLRLGLLTRSYGQAAPLLMRSWLLQCWFVPLAEVVEAVVVAALGGGALGGVGAPTCTAGTACGKRDRQQRRALLQTLAAAARSRQQQQQQQQSAQQPSATLTTMAAGQSRSFGRQQQQQQPFATITANVATSLPFSTSAAGGGGAIARLFLGSRGAAAPLPMATNTTAWQQQQKVATAQHSAPSVDIDASVPAPYAASLLGIGSRYGNANIPPLPFLGKTRALLSLLSAAADAEEAASVGQTAVSSAVAGGAIDPPREGGFSGSASASAASPSASLWAELLPMAEPLCFYPGDVIIREGERVTAIYFIRRGTAVVTAPTFAATYGRGAAAQPPTPPPAAYPHPLHHYSRAGGGNAGGIGGLPAAAASSFMQQQSSSSGHANDGSAATAAAFYESFVIGGGAVYGEWDCLFERPSAATVTAASVCDVWCVRHHALQQWFAGPPSDRVCRALSTAAIAAARRLFSRSSPTDSKGSAAEEGNPLGMGGVAASSTHHQQQPSLAALARHGTAMVGSGDASIGWASSAGTPSFADDTAAPSPQSSRAGGGATANSAAVVSVGAIGSGDAFADALILGRDSLPTLQTTSPTNADGRPSSSIVPQLFPTAAHASSWAEGVRRVAVGAAVVKRELWWLQRLRQGLVVEGGTSSGANTSVTASSPPRQQQQQQSVNGNGSPPNVFTARNGFIAGAPIATSSSAAAQGGASTATTALGANFFSSAAKPQQSLLTASPSAGLGLAGGGGSGGFATVGALLFASLRRIAALAQVSDAALRSLIANSRPNGGPFASFSSASSVGSDHSLHYGGFASFAYPTIFLPSASLTVAEGPDDASPSRKAQQQQQQSLPCDSLIVLLSGTLRSQTALPSDGAPELSAPGAVLGESALCPHRWYHRWRAVTAAEAWVFPCRAIVEHIVRVQGDGGKSTSIVQHAATVSSDALRDVEARNGLRQGTVIARVRNIDVDEAEGSSSSPAAVLVEERNYVSLAMDLLRVQQQQQQQSTPMGSSPTPLPPSAGAYGGSTAAAYNASSSPIRSVLAANAASNNTINGGALVPNRSLAFDARALASPAAAHQQQQHQQQQPPIAESPAQRNRRLSTVSFATSAGFLLSQRPASPSDTPPSSLSLAGRSFTHASPTSQASPTNGAAVHHSEAALLSAALMIFGPSSPAEGTSVPSSSLHSSPSRHHTAPSAAAISHSSSFPFYTAADRIAWRVAVAETLPLRCAGGGNCSWDTTRMTTADGAAASEKSLWLRCLGDDDDDSSDDDDEANNTAEEGGDGDEGAYPPPHLRFRSSADGADDSPVGAHKFVRRFFSDYFALQESRALLQSSSSISSRKGGAAKKGIVRWLRDACAEVVASAAALNAVCDEAAERELLSANTNTNSSGVFVSPPPAAALAPFFCPLSAACDGFRRADPLTAYPRIFALPPSQAAVNSSPSPPKRSQAKAGGSSPNNGLSSKGKGRSVQTDSTATPSATVNATNPSNAHSHRGDRPAPNTAGPIMGAGRGGVPSLGGGVVGTDPNTFAPRSPADQRGTVTYQRQQQQQSIADRPAIAASPAAATAARGVVSFLGQSGSGSVSHRTPYPPPYANDNSHPPASGGRPATTGSSVPSNSRYERDGDAADGDGGFPSSVVTLLGHSSSGSDDGGKPPPRHAALRAANSSIATAAPADDYAPSHSIAATDMTHGSSDSDDDGIRNDDDDDDDGDDLDILNSTQPQMALPAVSDARFPLSGSTVSSMNNTANGITNTSQSSPPRGGGGVSGRRVRASSASTDEGTDGPPMDFNSTAGSAGSDTAAVASALRGLMRKDTSTPADMRLSISAAAAAVAPSSTASASPPRPPPAAVAVGTGTAVVPSPAKAEKTVVGNNSSSSSSPPQQHQRRRINSLAAPSTESEGVRLLSIRDRSIAGGGPTRQVGGAALGGRMATRRLLGSAQGGLYRGGEHTPLTEGLAEEWGTLSAAGGARALAAIGGDGLPSVDGVVFRERRPTQVDALWTFDDPPSFDATALFGGAAAADGRRGSVVGFGRNRTNSVGLGHEGPGLGLRSIGRLGHAGVHTAEIEMSGDAAFLRGNDNDNDNAVGGDDSKSRGGRRSQQRRANGDGLGTIDLASEGADGNADGADGGGRRKKAARSGGGGSGGGGVLSVEAAGSDEDPHYSYDDEPDYENGGPAGISSSARGFGADMDMGGSTLVLLAHVTRAIVRHPLLGLDEANEGAAPLVAGGALLALPPPPAVAMGGGGGMYGAEESDAYPFPNTRSGGGTSSFYQQQLQMGGNQQQFSFSPPPFAALGIASSRQISPRPPLQQIEEGVNAQPRNGDNGEGSLSPLGAIREPAPASLNATSTSQAVGVAGNSSAAAAAATALASSVQAQLLALSPTDQFLCRILDAKGKVVLRTPVADISTAANIGAAAGMEGSGGAAAEAPGSSLLLPPPPQPSNVAGGSDTASSSADQNVATPPPPQPPAGGASHNPPSGQSSPFGGSGGLPEIGVAWARCSAASFMVNVGAVLAELAAAAEAEAEAEERRARRSPSTSPTLARPISAVAWGAPTPSSSLAFSKDPICFTVELRRCCRLDEESTLRLLAEETARRGGYASMATNGGGAVAMGGGPLSGSSGGDVFSNPQSFYSGGELSSSGAGSPIGGASAADVGGGGGPVAVAVPSATEVLAFNAPPHFPPAATAATGTAQQQQQPQPGGGGGGPRFYRKRAVSVSMVDHKGERLDIGGAGYHPMPPSPQDSSPPLSQVPGSSPPMPLGIPLTSVHHHRVGSFSPSPSPLGASPFFSAGPPNASAAAMMMPLIDEVACDAFKSVLIATTPLRRSDLLAATTGMRPLPLTVALPLATMAAMGGGCREANASEQNEKGTPEISGADNAHLTPAGGVLYLSFLATRMAARGPSGGMGVGVGAAKRGPKADNNNNTNSADSSSFAHSNSMDTDGGDGDDASSSASGEGIPASIAGVVGGRGGGGGGGVGGRSPSVFYTAGQSMPLALLKAGGGAPLDSDGAVGGGPSSVPASEGAFGGSDDDADDDVYEDNNDNEDDAVRSEDGSCSTGTSSAHFDTTALRAAQAQQRQQRGHQRNNKKLSNETGTSVSSGDPSAAAAPPPLMPLGAVEPLSAHNSKGLTPVGPTSSASLSGTGVDTGVGRRPHTGLADGYRFPTSASLAHRREREERIAAAASPSPSYSLSRGRSPSSPSQSQGPGFVHTVVVPSAASAIGNTGGLPHSDADVSDAAGGSGLQHHQLQQRRKSKAQRLSMLEARRAVRAASIVGLGGGLLPPSRAPSNLSSQRRRTGTAADVAIANGGGEGAAAAVVSASDLQNRMAADGGQRTKITSADEGAKAGGVLVLSPSMELEGLPVTEHHQIRSASSSSSSSSVGSSSSFSSSSSSSSYGSADGERPPSILEAFDPEALSLAAEGGGGEGGEGDPSTVDAAAKTAAADVRAAELNVFPETLVVQIHRCERLPLTVVPPPASPLSQREAPPQPSSTSFGDTVARLARLGSVRVRLLCEEEAEIAPAIAPAAGNGRIGGGGSMSPADGGGFGAFPSPAPSRPQSRQSISAGGTFAGGGGTFGRLPSGIGLDDTLASFSPSSALFQQQQHLLATTASSGGGGVVGGTSASSHQQKAVPRAVRVRTREVLRTADSSACAGPRIAAAAMERRRARSGWTAASRPSSSASALNSNKSKRKGGAAADSTVVAAAIADEAEAAVAFASSLIRAPTWPLSCAGWVYDLGNLRQRGTAAGGGGVGGGDLSSASHHQLRPRSAASGLLSSFQQQHYSSDNGGGSWLRPTTPSFVVGGGGGVQMRPTSAASAVLHSGGNIAGDGNNGFFSHAQQLQQLHQQQHSQPHRRARALIFIVEEAATGRVIGTAKIRLSEMQMEGEASRRRIPLDVSAYVAEGEAGRGAVNAAPSADGSDDGDGDGGVLAHTVGILSSTASSGSGALGGTLRSDDGDADGEGGASIVVSFAVIKATRAVPVTRKALGLPPLHKDPPMMPVPTIGAEGGIDALVGANPPHLMTSEVSALAVPRPPAAAAMQHFSGGPTPSQSRPQTPTGRGAGGVGAVPLPLSAANLRALGGGGSASAHHYQLLPSDGAHSAPARPMTAASAFAAPTAANTMSGAGGGGGGADMGLAFVLVGISQCDGLAVDGRGGVSSPLNDGTDAAGLFGNNNNDDADEGGLADPFVKVWVESRHRQRSPPPEEVLEELEGDAEEGEADGAGTSKDGMNAPIAPLLRREDLVLRTGRRRETRSPNYNTMKLSDRVGVVALRIIEDDAEEWLGERNAFVVANGKKEADAAFVDALGDVTFASSGVFGSSAQQKNVVGEGGSNKRRSPARGGGGADGPDDGIFEDDEDTPPISTAAGAPAATDADPTHQQQQQQQSSLPPPCLRVEVWDSADGDWLDLLGIVRAPMRRYLRSYSRVAAGVDWDQRGGSRKKKRAQMANQALEKKTEDRLQGPFPTALCSGMTIVPTTHSTAADSNAKRTDEAIADSSGLVPDGPEALHDTDGDGNEEEGPAFVPTRRTRVAVVSGGPNGHSISRRDVRGTVSIDVALTVDGANVPLSAVAETLFGPPPHVEEEEEEVASQEVATAISSSVAGARSQPPPAVPSALPSSPAAAGADLSTAKRAAGDATKPVSAPSNNTNTNTNSNNNSGAAFARTHSTAAGGMVGGGLRPPRSPSAMSRAHLEASVGGGTKALAVGAAVGLRSNNSAGGDPKPKDAANCDGGDEFDALLLQSPSTVTASPSGADVGQGGLGDGDSLAFSSNYSPPTATATSTTTNATTMIGMSAATASTAAHHSPNSAAFSVSASAAAADASPIACDDDSGANAKGDANNSDARRPPLLGEEHATDGRARPEGLLRIQGQPSSPPSSSQPASPSSLPALGRQQQLASAAASPPEGSKAVHGGGEVLPAIRPASPPPPQLAVAQAGEKPQQPQTEEQKRTAKEKDVLLTGRVFGGAPPLVGKYSTPSTSPVAILTPSSASASPSLPTVPRASAQQHTTTASNTRYSANANVNGNTIQNNAAAAAGSIPLVAPPPVLVSLPAAAPLSLPKAFQRMAAATKSSAEASKGLIGGGGGLGSSAATNASPTSAFSPPSAGRAGRTSPLPTAAMPTPQWPAESAASAPLPSLPQAMPWANANANSVAPPSNAFPPTAARASAAAAPILPAASSSSLWGVRAGVGGGGVGAANLLNTVNAITPPPVGDEQSPVPPPVAAKTGANVPASAAIAMGASSSESVTFGAEQPPAAPVIVMGQQQQPSGIGQSRTAAAPPPSFASTGHGQGAAVSNDRGVSSVARKPPLLATNLFGPTSGIGYGGGGGGGGVLGVATSSSSLLGSAAVPSGPSSDAFSATASVLGVKRGGGGASAAARHVHVDLSAEPQPQQPQQPQPRRPTPPPMPRGSEERSTTIAHTAASAGVVATTAHAATVSTTGTSAIDESDNGNVAKGVGGADLRSAPNSAGAYRNSIVANGSSAPLAYSEEDRSSEGGSGGGGGTVRRGGSASSPPLPHAQRYATAATASYHTNSLNSTVGSGTSLVSGFGFTTAEGGGGGSSAGAATALAGTNANAAHTGAVGGSSASARLPPRGGVPPSALLSLPTGTATAPSSSAGGGAVAIGGLIDRRGVGGAAPNSARRPQGTLPLASFGVGGGMGGGVHVGGGHGGSRTVIVPSSPGLLFRGGGGVNANAWGASASAQAPAAAEVVVSEAPADAVVAAPSQPQPQTAPATAVKATAPPQRIVTPSPPPPRAVPATNGASSNRGTDYPPPQPLASTSTSGSGGGGAVPQQQQQQQQRSIMAILRGGRV